MGRGRVGEVLCGQEGGVGGAWDGGGGGKEVPFKAAIPKHSLALTGPSRLTVPPPISSSLPSLFTRQCHNVAAYCAPCRVLPYHIRRPSLAIPFAYSPHG